MSDHPQPPGDKIADRSAHPPTPATGGAGAPDPEWEFRRDTEYLYKEVPNIAKPGVEPEPAPGSNGKAKAGGVGFVVFIIIYAIIRVVASSARNNNPPPQVQFPPPQFQMPPPQQFQMPPVAKMPDFRVPDLKPLQFPAIGGANVPIRTFRNGHKGGILAFAFNDTMLITAGNDGLLRTWDLRDGQRLKELSGHGGQVTSVVMGSNNTALSGGVDGKVHLWDLTTGEAIKTFGPYPGGVTAVAAAPADKSLVVACGLKKIRYSYFEPIALGNPEPVRRNTEELHWLRPTEAVCQAFIVDMETGETKATLSGHRHELTCAAFAPDGLHVVTGSFDKTIRMWEKASGREVRRFEETGAVLAVAVSPDGTQLLTGAGKVDTAPGRNPSTSRVVLIANPQRVHGGVNPADVKDTKGMGSARLWNLKTGDLIRAMPAHDFPVLSVAFDSAGDSFVTADFSGKIKLWRRDQDEPAATHNAGRAVSQVRFQADGRLLSSSWNSIVSQWQAAP